MKITYYDSPTTNYDEEYRLSYTIHPSIIVSDSMTFSVKNSWAKALLEDVDSWSNEKIMANFRECFEGNDSAKSVIDYYDKMIPVMKNLNKQKSKSKDVVGAINNFSIMYKLCKAEMRKFANEVIVRNNLSNCMPFAEGGVFILKPIDYKQKDNKEDDLISEIKNLIIQREETLLFDKKVEQLYSFSHYEEVENNTSDFIKIPLWDLPMLDEFDYKQLKYTRDDLHPALAPFKMQLKQLSDEIFPLQFIDENIEQLKYLCQSQLQKFVQPIQHSIDESIYISQTRNKSQAWNKLTLNLGITSVENLIQYYEKVETVEPYVANEIKRQTARYLDLKASCFFMYFEQHIIQADAI